MKKYLKFTSAILSAGILITPVSTLVNNYNNYAKAEYNENEKNSFEIEIDLSKIDVENELNNAKILLESNLISQEEYDMILMILKPELFFNPYSRSYYPEQKIAYINNWGVQKIYAQLPYIKGATEGIKFLVGLSLGPFGWGLGALSVIQAFGGYDAYEKAVQQAYWQGKGIDVYYQIHKGVTSLNKLRFEVI